KTFSLWEKVAPSTPLRAGSGRMRARTNAASLPEAKDQPGRRETLRHRHSTWRAHRGALVDPSLRSGLKAAAPWLILRFAQDGGELRPPLLQQRLRIFLRRRLLDFVVRI